MDAVEWIEKELAPQVCYSDELIYNHMESQSGRCLPIIYEPFDAGNRAHWRDRGSAFDYYFSCGSGRLLDFGPGDGWPSLVVAPMVEEVVGADASQRRVDVCAGNAAKLGIANARFVRVPAGGRLPFDDSSFDGVMAASSIEQTPDPQAALRELYRVLRSGGRLRMTYEGLKRYRGGGEREACFWPLDKRKTMLILYDRDIDNELAWQYVLTLAMDQRRAAEAFGVEGETVPWDRVTTDRLGFVRNTIVQARKCLLRHPSGSTWVSMLHEAGFAEIRPTHSGSRFGGELFETINARLRPDTLAGVDEVVRPAVAVAVRLEAPVHEDPMMTAIK